MEQSNPGRIIFDLTTTLRWAGTPVGIVRVERELALRARANPDIVFAFFNPIELKFHAIESATVDAFLFGGASLDTLGLNDPAKPGRRRTERIPPALRSAALWVLQSRRKLFQTIERIRLRAGNASIAAIVERMQRPLITEKYRSMLLKPDGSRRAHMTPDMVSGPAIQFQSGDTLVCVGSSWAHLNIEAISRARQHIGFRLVVLCHDIIPLLFPHFYMTHDVEAFRDYFHIAFPASDIVLFTSRKVESDALSYCHLHGLALRQTAVVPLGASFPSAKSDNLALPAGLQKDRYALFVSTIEPRKGHALIYDVWLKLLQENVPQRSQFKLVFVGRPGWMVDGLMRALKEDARLADTLLVLTNVGDDLLESLYQGAAFCLYPSMYEGYGLPVVEAFFHGKAVLASNGGALPEVAGEFSPCLDPMSPDLWHDMLKRWIEEPAARAPYEQAIRSRFSHPTWDDAAAAFFASIRNTDKRAIVPKS